jgi:hypothetical protein
MQRNLIYIPEITGRDLEIDSLAELARRAPPRFNVLQRREVMDKFTALQPEGAASTSRASGSPSPSASARHVILANTNCSEQRARPISKHRRLGGFGSVSANARLARRGFL